MWFHCLLSVMNVYDFLWQYSDGQLSTAMNSFINNNNNNKLTISSMINMALTRITRAQMSMYHKSH